MIRLSSYHPTLHNLDTEGAPLDIPRKDEMKPLTTASVRAVMRTRYMGAEVPAARPLNGSQWATVSGGSVRLSLDLRGQQLNSLRHSGT
jgi:hypothetical protein